MKPAALALLLAGCVHPWVGVCVAPREFYSGYEADWCAVASEDRQTVVCQFRRDGECEIRATFGCGDWELLPDVQCLEDKKEPAKWTTPLL